MNLKGWCLRAGSHVSGAPSILRQMQTDKLDFGEAQVVSIEDKKFYESCEISVL